MTQKYQVKVSMKQAAIVETGIVLKQGDFGMQIEIEVLDFDATGTTPQIVFRKAMGAVESTTITVSGNKYTYTFKGTELDTPGKCFCDLKLKNSTTQRISTASFMFKVVADTLDGLAEEASSYSDTIEQLLENTLQKSETAGLVKNDGTIDSEIQNKVDFYGASITNNFDKLKALQKGTSYRFVFEAGYIAYHNAYITQDGQTHLAVGHCVIKISDTGIKKIIIPKLNLPALAQLYTVLFFNNETFVSGGYASITESVTIQAPETYTDLYFNWWNGETDDPSCTYIDLYNYDDFLRYTNQILTNQQKETARDNLNAANKSEFDILNTSMNQFAKYDYSDSLTNDGYINHSGQIISVTGGWKYSDLIEIPEEIRGKNASIFIRAQLQRSASSAVAGVAFYQNTQPLKTICIDHITSDTGEICYIYEPIQKEATHIRFCSFMPSAIGFFAKILNGKEAITDDSMNTISDKIALDCIQYAGEQNGYLNINGVFVEIQNASWTTSDFIDVNYFNTVRCNLKGMNVTSVLALYNANKIFIRGIQPEATGQNYAFLTGDYDISDAAYIRICFYMVARTEAESINCTAYNRYLPGDANNQSVNNINHIVNKPFIFNEKKAVFCGDSITRGFTSGTTTTENGYPKVFSNAVGLSFINSGVGGASIARVSGFGCIQDQVTAVDLDNTDFIFIAGGVNDWQLGVSLADFRSAVKSICDYLNTEEYAGEVIFILPINEAGWTPVRTPVANLNDYRVILKEIALQYEHSIINGEMFDFPTKDSDGTYISALFGDRLHPTEKGYRMYAKALKTILC